MFKVFLHLLIIIYSNNAKDKVSGWMTKDSSVVNSGPSKYSPPVMVSKCLKHMVIVVCVMANLREHMNATKKTLACTCKE